LTPFLYIFLLVGVYYQMLWVFKSDWDSFSAPVIKGRRHPLEQVNIAAKADCGLKLSS
jgi:hypothetical protein